MASINKQSNRQSFREKLQTNTAAGSNLTLIRKKEEELATQRKANSLGIAYINLKFIPINPDALKILTQEQAKKAGMIIFQRSGIHLKIAIADINNPLTKTILQQFYQKEYQIELYLVSKYSLEKGYASYDFLQDRGQIVKDRLLIPEHMIKDAQSDIVKLEDFADKINSV